MLKTHITKVPPGLCQDGRKGGGCIYQQKIIEHFPHHVEKLVETMTLLVEFWLVSYI